ncbi:MAG: T9SS type A sorting domain-containing protein [Bacteroidota bacterium]
MKKCLNVFYLILCTCFITYGYAHQADEHLPSISVTEKNDFTETCSYIDRLECVVEEGCRRTYEFRIIFCEGGEAAFIIGVSSQLGIVYDLQFSNRPFPAPPGEYIVSGTFEPAVGVNEFCLDIVYDDGILIDPTPLEIQLCSDLPDCPCMVSNEVINQPECIRPGEVFCIEYNFDFCGDSGLPLEWVVDGTGFSVIPNGADDIVLVGPNSVEVCFIYRGDCPNPNRLNFALNGAIENTACELRFNTNFRCCPCIPLAPSITFGNCTSEGISQFYQYTILVPGGADIAGDFDLSTQLGILTPPLWSVAPNGLDLLINGILRIDGATPGEICLTLDPDDPIYCPVEDICFDLPPCCERIHTFNPTMSCEVGEEGRVYDFSFEIGRPQGRSFAFTVSTTCGRANFNSILTTVNSYTISGTLRDLQVEPGEVCCFDINYTDPSICDDQLCIEIPECEGCYDNLVVDAPDCLESSGQTFCVTYTFDYFGPPTTGVSITWFPLLSTSNDIQLLSATNQTPGLSGSAVTVGENTWELCFTYGTDATVCEGTVPLDVRAVMFTSEGIECCSFRDAIDFECCCDVPDIAFEWCGVDGEQLKLVAESLGREEMDLSSMVDGLSDCDGQPCCFICEDGIGPIFALDANTQAIFPNPPYTYQWGGPIDGPTNQAFIIGKPGVTYTVTVTNTSQENCSTVASITVDCSGGGGQLREDPFVLQWQQELGQDLRVFPNPSSDQLRLNGSMIREGVQVRLISLTGQQLLTRAVQDRGQMQLNTTELPAGTYFIQLQDAQGRLLTSQRIVIMH